MACAGLSKLSSEIRCHLNEKGISEIYWQSFKLKMIGERGNIILIPGKLWSNMKKLNGEGTCDGPLHVTLRRTSRSGAQLQCCRDELRTPEIIEMSRENILVLNSLSLYYIHSQSPFQVKI